MNYIMSINYGYNMYLIIDDYQGKSTIIKDSRQEFRTICLRLSKFHSKDI